MAMLLGISRIPPTTVSLGAVRTANRSIADPLLVQIGSNPARPG
jgi:hypothetical protein